MYRSARVTDLIIDVGTFLYLLQKAEDGEKVSAGGKQLHRKQKGKKAKAEEEGEEMKCPRGRAAHSLAAVDSSS